MICSGCGQKAGAIARLTTEWGADSYLCQACSEKAAERRRAEERAEARRQEEAKRRAGSVIVTSTMSVEGWRIVRYFGVESVEFVIGTGMFSEFSSSLADIFGARSTAFEIKLQHAKQHDMLTLKTLAAYKGANAVVGVDLDYTEFTNNRIGLIVNGTLVLVEPTQEGAEFPLGDAVPRKYPGTQHPGDTPPAATIAPPPIDDDRVSWTCKCGRPLSTERRFSGKAAQCPQCKERSIVPG